MKHIPTRCASFMFVFFLIAVDVKVLLPEPLMVGIVDVDLCPVVTKSTNCHVVLDSLRPRACKN